LSKVAKVSAAAVNIMGIVVNLNCPILFTIMVSALANHGKNSAQLSSIYIGKMLQQKCPQLRQLLYLPFLPWVARHK
jgi:hypothetical protein